MISRLLLLLTLFLVVTASTCRPKVVTQDDGSFVDKVLDPLSTLFTSAISVFRDPPLPRCSDLMMTHMNSYYGEPIRNLTSLLRRATADVVEWSVATEHPPNTVLSSNNERGETFAAVAKRKQAESRQAVAQIQKAIADYHDASSKSTRRLAHECYEEARLSAESIYEQMLGVDSPRDMGDVVSLLSLEGLSYHFRKAVFQAILHSRVVLNGLVVHLRFLYLNTLLPSGRHLIDFITINLLEAHIGGSLNVLTSNKAEIVEMLLSGVKFASFLLGGALLLVTLFIVAQLLLPVFLWYYLFYRWMWLLGFMGFVSSYYNELVKEANGSMMTERVSLVTSATYLHEFIIKLPVLIQPLVQAILLIAADPIGAIPLVILGNAVLFLCLISSIPLFTGICELLTTEHFSVRPPETKPPSYLGRNSKAK